MNPTANWRASSDFRLSLLLLIGKSRQVGITYLYRTIDFLTWIICPWL